jgi:N-glycosylase/DNA lyase
MLDKLRARYGTLLCTVGGRPYYSFPSPSSLSHASEGDLRGLGLGYRARYIQGAAARVVDMGGESALLALRGQPLEHTRSFLQQFDAVPASGDCHKM